jgi:hypothetical protein
MDKIAPKMLNNSENSETKMAVLAPRCPNMAVRKYEPSVFQNSVHFH